MLREMGLFHARDSRARRGARGVGPRAVRRPRRAARRARRSVRRRARARAAAAALPAGGLARPRRPRRRARPGVVRRLRRARRRAGAGVRQRGGRRRAASGPAARGPRGAGARAGRRGPDRARAVRRLPARPQVPPEPAVPADAPAPAFDPARVHRLRAASAEPEPAHPDPLVGPLVRVLSRHFPEAIAVADLRRTLGATAGDVERALWAAVDADLVALHVDAPVYAEIGGIRPRASALARLQARDAIDVTSLRHENVRMEEPAARGCSAARRHARPRRAARRAGGRRRAGARARRAGRQPRRPGRARAAARVSARVACGRCGTSARSACARSRAAST